MKNITQKGLERRTFVTGTLKAALIACLVSPLAFLQGCTASLSQILTEVANIMQFIAPLIGGVLPLVEIADPAVAPAVNAGNAIFQTGVSTLSALFMQWSQASAAAQPGILAQIQAGAASLKGDLSNLLAAAQVKDQTTQAEITGLFSAGFDELAEILTLIPELQSAGGTTAALKGVTHKYHGYYQNAKWHRNLVVKRLHKQTGNNALDTQRAMLAQKLAALKLS